jgi:hypothetical protein
MLIGALSISLLFTGATVTLAQSSAISSSKPATKATLAQGIPLPPSPPGPRDVSVTIPLPGPELLEPQSEPDCEIPSSDRLLGTISETTRLIYERECYKNAETVVRSKLQLLQDAIASPVKALEDAGASGTLRSAEGRAKDVTITSKGGMQAKISEAAGDPGDRRDTRSDPSRDQGVESPDQHRKLAPSERPSVNLSSLEGDVPKSSSPDAPVSGRARPISFSRRPRPQKPPKWLTDVGQLLFEPIIAAASCGVLGTQQRRQLSAEGSYTASPRTCDRR